MSNLPCTRPAGLLICFYALGNRVQHTLAALGKQEETKNVEILEENHARESTVRSRAAAIPLWQIKERTGNEKFHPSRGRPGPFEKETAHEHCRLKLSVL
jgi:hypothetical protein